MATTTITPDNDAVVSQIEIAAPPERVFQALIDRAQAMQWGTSDAYEMTVWEMDARLGGKWRFVSTMRKGKNPGKNHDHHGEISVFDPPRLLEYSWFADWHPDASRGTLVRWELTPTKSGTHLKMTHSGLAQVPGACEGYSQGWPGLMLAIKNFLEK